VKALVYVTLKSEVLDPQGRAVQRACDSLGYAGVRDVRQGKLFEIELEAADEGAARALLEELCQKLLANPVIEDYRVVRIESD
jgi:phosphoribosylformylglycinamidine synthase PurS subunit